MAGGKSDRRELARLLRVKPGTAARLARIDPDGTPGLARKLEPKAALPKLTAKLIDRQAMLYAESRRAVLVVLQAMDTGGKDGTVRRVLGPLNPQGVTVTSFKAPTPEELAHDFLWRVHRAVPPKGMIGVFNRSHYEDVLIVRVHGLAPAKAIERRYEQINAFERMLTENGVTILKLFLHISREEQRRRLQARLDQPDKRWKFNVADLAERKRWAEYAAAYETALSRCSTPWAPWYVIPADDKAYRNWAVASLLLHATDGMDLRFPPGEPGLDGIVVEP